MREKIHEIIFEADTRPGKIFDIALMLMIILSVVIVVLESVESYAADYGSFFRYAEWTLTIIFTIEYLLRIYSIHKPWKYVFSFYGIVDLLAILPTYLSLFIVGSHYLPVSYTHLRAHET